LVEYFSGTIERYDDRNGYGYIIPDDPSSEDERYLVHRRSLRDATSILEPGMRVLFKTKPVPTGILAADVHVETSSGPELFPIDERQLGEITWINLARGYGFIRTDAGESAFFHISSLPPGDAMYPVSTKVSFDIVPTERGLSAFNILRVSKSTAPDEVHSSADILARAILARDSRDPDEAKRLYELGMKSAPSTQLITSYAATRASQTR